MRNILIGTFLLIAGSALSQTTQQKAAASKPTSATTASPVKPKTLSGNSNNPNYQKEQKKYNGPDRDYKPRRTDSGARKDAAKGDKS